MEEELTAFGNKLVEAFNRGGKAGMDEMLKRDGWLVGGGFFKQMRPDGQGKLHPVQTIPIAQIRHYVSGLVDPQTHQPVSDIDSAIGGQAGASRVGATPVPGLRDSTIDRSEN